MAISSANPVTQAPVAGATAANGAPVTGMPTPGSAAFTDALQAVLAKSATPNAQTSANDDLANIASTAPDNASAQQTPLGKLKSKLKNGVPETGIAAQLTQQQAAAIKKLQATNTGIDLPALRAAMGKTAKTQPATAKAAEAADTEPQKDKATATTGNATQTKLAVALAKVANAPVLKTGAKDGSTVPNKKIGHAAHAKDQDKKTAANSQDVVTAMAVKMAATSAATNNSDTPLASAQGVAAAEVSTQRATATATPAITKIEAAAVSNATDTALHAPAPEAKLEAQALPVQFDAKSAKADDGKNGAQDSGDKSKGDGKDSAAGAAGTRTAPAPAKTADALQTFSDAQQSAPQDTAPAAQSSASQHTAAATTNGTAAAASSPVSAPAASSNIATAFQVMQQPSHLAPQQAPDLAALGVSIAAKSKDGDKQFDIKMDPAELGRVDVRISVDSDGKAQAHLTAEKPQTLQLLQNDKTTLERSLRDAGLDLSNNGLNFSLKGEQQSSTPTFVARTRALSIATVQTVDSISSNSGSSIAPGDSRLDIRV